MNFYNISLNTQTKLKDIAYFPTNKTAQKLLLKHSINSALV